MSYEVSPSTGHRSVRKRHRVRNWTIVIILVLASGGVAVLAWKARGGQPTPTPSLSAPASISPSALPPNDLAAGTLTRSYKGLGGTITASLTLATSYDVKHWKILDDKYMTMTVKATGYPAGATIYLERIRLDATLESNVNGLGGKTQSSVEYTGPSDVISAPSEGVAIPFKVEGQSTALNSLWSNVTNARGPLRSVPDKDFKESTLRNEGRVIGTRFVISNFIVDVKLPGGPAGSSDKYPTNIAGNFDSVFVPVG